MSEQKTVVSGYSGPEFQILDNKKHQDGRDPKTTASFFYAMYAPVRDVTRSVGQWNAARIIVVGNHVEHWMNGTKLLEYELGSPEWKTMVSRSKFNGFATYGKLKKGHVVLQDHVARCGTVTSRSVKFIWIRSEVLQRVPPIKIATQSSEMETW